MGFIYYMNFVAQQIRIVFIKNPSEIPIFRFFGRAELFNVTDEKINYQACKDNKFCWNMTKRSLHFSGYNV